MDTSANLRHRFGAGHLVRVWTLEPEDCAWPSLAEAWLNPDEHSRAAGCLRQSKRREFMACRAALRGLLGLQLGCDPWELSFRYGPFGQPSLVQAPLHFSLAHTDGMALIALGFVAVGVDVERLPTQAKNFSEIARTVFGPAECDQVNRAGAGQMEVFYRIWTAKEAALKARGLGIGQIDQAPTVNGCNPDPWGFWQAGLPWRVQPLRLGANHVGALVAQTEALSVEQRTLEPMVLSQLFEERQWIGAASVLA